MCSKEVCFYNMSISINMGVAGNKILSKILARIFI